MNAPPRLCLSGLAVAGLVAAVSAPAHATLQIAVSVNGGPSVVCVDNIAVAHLETAGVQR
jgi:hypothetical protein